MAALRHLPSYLGWLRKDCAENLVMRILVPATVLCVQVFDIRAEPAAPFRNANAITTGVWAVDTALSRAVQQIDASMVGMGTYPRFSTGEALGSTGDVATCSDLLTSEAVRYIPASLQADAQNVAQLRCHWQGAGNSGEETGRVAYVIVNASCTLDANHMGGTDRVWSKSIGEIDLRKVPGVLDPNLFLSCRTRDASYDSLPTLYDLNEGLDPGGTESLFVYSFDPGRDECFTNRLAKSQKLGCATTNDLMLKLNINEITNIPLPYVGDPRFTAYTNRLLKLIQDAGVNTVKPEDVMWNIINWIDADRHPQISPDDNPAYVSTQGSEALPLINEIARLALVSNTYMYVTNARGEVFTNLLRSTTSCQVAVEVWYPFVVEHEDWKPGGSVNYALQVFTQPAGGGFMANIDPMAYGGASNSLTPEFRVLKGPLCSPTVTGIYAIVYEGTTNDIINGTALPVDAAPTRTGSPAVPTFWTWPTNGFYGIEVDDPRANCKSVYWTIPVNGVGAMTNSLGRMNYKCDPWGTNSNWPQPNERQGLPIYIKNGPIENIAELGHIFLSNRENFLEFENQPWKHFWCTIDLLSSDQGAYLLDYITTGSSNRAAHGFVTLNALDPEQKTLRTLFDNMTIGWSNDLRDAKCKLDLDASEAQALVRDLALKIWDRTVVQLPRGAISFDDLFKKSAESTNDDVRSAFRAFGNWWSSKLPDHPKPNDMVYEDVFRNIVEMISFRQNVFLVVLATETVHPDCAIENNRGVAVVYRDAYTGNSRLVSYTSLSHTVDLPAALYVSQTGTHQYPYTNWLTAAQDIQSAVAAAPGGAVVLVSNGVYATGSTAVSGLGACRVAIGKPITVRSVNGPGATSIVGQPTDSGGVGDGAVRCAYVGTNAALVGFTLTNGFTRAYHESNDVTEASGGGAWCEVSGSLSNCVIVGNSAARIGGGCYQGRLYNCMVAGNSSANLGGGVAEAALRNCTVVGNTSGYGGGTWNGTACNSILFYNTASGAGDNWRGGTFQSCCMAPLPSSGSGNTSGAPGIVSVAELHLLPGSSCIDSGLDEDWMETAVDVDEESRVNGAVDIGADEYYAGSETGALDVAFEVDSPVAAVGAPFRFAAQVQGRPLSYEWQWGDGQSESDLCLATHSYGATGLYTVVLTASNSSGVASATGTVLVAAGHLLTAVTGPNGSVSPAWINVLSGRDAVFTVQPDPCYHIETIETNGWLVGSNLGWNSYAYVWSNVTEDGTLSIVFAENRGTNYDTPHTWMAGYGYSGDVNTLEMTIGGNGLPLWQSYVSDVNPTDPTGVFRISHMICDPNDNARITFNSSTGRQYTLYRTLDPLGSNSWFGVEGQTNIRGRGGAMVLSDTNATAPRFYRIQVDLPQNEP
jgi:PKD repeat protein